MSCMAITPKLVRVFDFNYLPLDLWIISEFHQWNPPTSQYLSVPSNPVQEPAIGHLTTCTVNHEYFDPNCIPSNALGHLTACTVNHEYFDPNCIPSNASDYQCHDGSVSVDSLVRMTTTGSFFIENPTLTVSAFFSSNTHEWGFSNQFSRIIQLKDKPTCFSLTLNSGIICYVKLTERGITFSSNRNGISYLMDEAGVRTCWDSFPRLNLTPQTMWERHSLHPDPVGETSDNLWQMESENQPVKFSRSKQSFWSENHELDNLSLTLGKNVKLSSSTRQGVAHIFFSDEGKGHHFKHSIYFNGRTLKMKYHTQSAGLDNHGLLLL